MLPDRSTPQVPETSSISYPSSGVNRKPTVPPVVTTTGSEGEMLPPADAVGVTVNSASSTNVTVMLQSSVSGGTECVRPSQVPLQPKTLLRTHPSKAEGVILMTSPSAKTGVTKPTLPTSGQLVPLSVFRAALRVTLGANY